MPYKFPVPGGNYNNSWGAPRSGGRTHEGVDIFAPHGSPIVAPADGVVQMGNYNRSGNFIRFFDGAGNKMFMGHLSGFAVQDGAVKVGQIIGYVGDTGNAKGTSPHVHFEYHPGNAGPVNPFPLLKGMETGAVGMLEGGPLDLSNTTYDMVIGQAAAQYGVPFGVLKALLMSESSLNPNAGRGTDYEGIAQFFKGTWSGGWNPYNESSPYDPNAAIFASALYLKNLWGQTGNLAEALALYKGFGNKGGYSNARAKELVDKVLYYYGQSYSVTEGNASQYTDQMRTHQKNVWKRKMLPDDLRKIQSEIERRGEPTPLTTSQTAQKSVDYIPGVTELGGS
jgi:hypothetical protein